jgi:hypothetical protein
MQEIGRKDQDLPDAPRRSFFLHGGSRSRPDGALARLPIGAFPSISLASAPSPERGPRGRHSDHSHPDAAAAARWPKADHDAGERGGIGTKAEPRRDPDQGAGSSASLATADRERPGAVDHRPCGAAGRHGRLRLPATAAHLPGARHCGGDPRWQATERAEAGAILGNGPMVCEEQRARSGFERGANKAHQKSPRLIRTHDCRSRVVGLGVLGKRQWLVAGSCAHIGCACGHSAAGPAHLSGGESVPRRALSSDGGGGPPDRPLGKGL